MKENKLLSRPHLVFNCDETAIVLNKSSKMVVVPRKSKHCHTIMNTSTQHVTALCCASAAGIPIPPMLVFTKNLPAGRNFHNDGPANCTYASTESGFVDRSTYVEWFNKVLLRYAPSERPLLLLQDGASAHISPDLIDTAIQNEVIILCFPAKLTHLLQPCDVGIYKTLKSNLRAIMQQVKLLRGELWTSKSHIPAIFREVFEKTFTPQLITSAFRSCGIYPLNRSVVQAKVLTPPINDTTEEKELQKKNKSKGKTCN